MLVSNISFYGIWNESNEFGMCKVWIMTLFYAIHPPPLYLTLNDIPMSHWLISWGPPYLLEAFWWSLSVLRQPHTSSTRGPRFSGFLDDQIFPWPNQVWVSHWRVIARFSLHQSHQWFFWFHQVISRDYQEFIGSCAGHLPFCSRQSKAYSQPYLCAFPCL